MFQTWAALDIVPYNKELFVSEDYVSVGNIFFFNLGGGICALFLLNFEKKFSLEGKENTR